MSDEDFLAQSGFSPEEQQKAETRQVVENAWDKMEGIFGNYRDNVRKDAFNKMRDAGYLDVEIKKYNPHQDSDDVHVTHHHGEWHAHWYGTGHMEVHHNSRPDIPLDAIGVSDEIHKNKYEEHQKALEEWVRENGAHHKTHVLPTI